MQPIHLVIYGLQTQTEQHRWITNFPAYQLALYEAFLTHLNNPYLYIRKYASYDGCPFTTEMYSLWNVKNETAFSFDKFAKFKLQYLDKTYIRTIWTYETYQRIRKHLDEINDPNFVIEWVNTPHQSFCYSLHYLDESLIEEKRKFYWEFVDKHSEN